MKGSLVGPCVQTKRTDDAFDTGTLESPRFMRNAELPEDQACHHRRTNAMTVASSKTERRSNRTPVDELT